MDVNLRGPLLCTQAVLPSMLDAGGGRIINGLSAGAFVAGGIYGISKYALHSLTANLASELGPQGINVNAIAPGLVAAESGYASLPKESPIRTALEAGIPGQEVGPARGPRRARCCCSVRAPETGSTARPSASTAAGSCDSDVSSVFLCRGRKSATQLATQTPRRRPLRHGADFPKRWYCSMLRDRDP